MAGASRYTECGFYLGARYKKGWDCIRSRHFLVPQYESLKRILSVRHITDSPGSPRTSCIELLQTKGQCNNA